jgi:hypothetical protein
VLPPFSGFKCVVKEGGHRYRWAMRGGRGKVGYTTNKFNVLEERVLQRAYKKKIQG